MFKISSKDNYRTNILYRIVNSRKILEWYFQTRAGRKPPRDHRHDARCRCRRLELFHNRGPSIRMKSRVSTGVHHARVSNMCSLARVRNLRRSLIMRMYTLLSNTHVYVHGSVVRSSNSTLDTTGDAARIRLSYLNRRERAALDRQRDRIVLEKLVDSRTGIRDSRSRLPIRK